jgi:hypothetical protein
LYKFNRRQDRAFEQIIVVARSTVKEVDKLSDTNSESTNTKSEVEDKRGKPAITEI